MASGGATGFTYRSLLEDERGGDGGETRTREVSPPPVGYAAAGVTVPPDAPDGTAVRVQVSDSGPT